jgi:hypothetical protein
MSQQKYLVSVDAAFCEAVDVVVDELGLVFVGHELLRLLQLFVRQLEQRAEVA